MIADSCSWNRVDLLVGELEPREPRDVQHLVSVIAMAVVLP